MTQPVVASLLEALGEVSDPRQRRGVRHPFTGLLALTVLGLLSRIRELAVLVRWARQHWEVLREPLGFTTAAPPHATTLSRALARFSLEELQAAWAGWLQGLVAERTELVAAVDGKTSKQGLEDGADPLQMLHVFAQDVKACLAQWPLDGDKRSEPELLKAHLKELWESYPALRLLTGDALFAQRNLAELLVESGHDYLFQIKANQPDVLEALVSCLGQAHQRPPDAQTVEKRGAASRLVVFGSTWTTPDMSVSGWLLPVANCCSASTAPGGMRPSPRRRRRGTSRPA